MNVLDLDFYYNSFGCRYSELRIGIGIALVEKRAVLLILNPFSPGFGTRSTNPGLKGPSFSPGFAPGTKCFRLVIPTGAKEASRPGHVGRPFSPSCYYQPGLNVLFSFFLFVSIFN